MSDNQVSRDDMLAADWAWVSAKLEEANGIIEGLTRDLASARSALAEREKEVEGLRGDLDASRKQFLDVWTEVNVLATYAGAGPGDVSVAVIGYRLGRQDRIISKLVDALRPFAIMADLVDSSEELSWKVDNADLRRARALVEKYSR